MKITNPTNRYSQMNIAVAVNGRLDDYALILRWFPHNVISRLRQ
jgi:hypothetical protein